MLKKDCRAKQMVIEKKSGAERRVRKNFDYVL